MIKALFECTVTVIVLLGILFIGCLPTEPQEHEIHTLTQDMRVQMVELWEAGNE